MSLYSVFLSNDKVDWIKITCDSLYLMMEINHDPWTIFYYNLPDISKTAIDTLLFAHIDVTAQIYMPDDQYSWEANILGDLTSSDILGSATLSPGVYWVSYCET